MVQELIMEISEAVYNWLLQNNNLFQAPTIEGGRIFLHTEDTQRIENGLAYVTLIQKLLKHSPVPNLSSLKDQASSTAKLYNWNVLIPALESLGYGIDTDTKALLVAGDHETNLEILKHLISLDIPAKKKKRVNIEGAILIGNIEVSASLEDTESTLEFLILSMTQQMDIKPKQAAGLLTESGKYLEQVTLRGIKGDFEPVFNWYKCILENCQHLAKLINKEQGALGLVMNALKSGLTSTEPSIIQVCCLSLCAMHSSLPDQEGDVWEWFLSTDLISLAIPAYQRNPGVLAESISRLLLTFGSNRLIQVFGELLSHYSPDMSAYFGVLTELLIHLRRDESFVKQATDQGLIVYLIKNGAREISEGNLNVRVSGLFCMCEIWQTYSVEDHMISPILSEIRQSVKERSKSFKLTIIGRTFALLSDFYDKNSPYADLVHKTLSFILLDNYGQALVREFVYANTINLIEEKEGVSVSFTLESCIMQLQTGKFSLNTFDFDFIIACARHPSLEIRHVILLLDILGKIYISDFRFSKSAGIPLMILASRFMNSRAVQEFLLRFLSTGFRLFLSQYKPSWNSFEDSTKENNYLRNVLIKMTEKLVRLGNDSFNDACKDILILVNTEARAIGGNILKGLVFILNMMGERQVELSRESSANNLSVAIPEGRAVSDIEKIAKKRRDKEIEQRSHSEQQKFAEHRQKVSLKKQIEKRRLELGVSSRIAETERAIPHTTPRNDKNVLSDPEEESEFEQGLLYLVMKRYKRASKMLFGIYASSGAKKDITLRKDFENVRMQKEQLFEGQTFKLLRDNGLTKHMVSSELARQIYRQILHKFKVTCLDYDLFLIFLYQISLQYFAKDTNRDLSHFPSAISLKALFELFSLSDVIPRVIYEDPDSGTGDRDVISNLNEQLLANPEMEVPYGYKKVKENVIEVYYEVPECLEIPEGFVLALELIDEIVNNAIGSHVLEANIEINEITKARGTLNKPEIINGSKAGGVPSHKATYKALPLPAYMSFTPAIKITIGRMTGHYANNSLLEIARLVDDLVHTVCNNSDKILSRNPKAPSKIENPYKVQKAMESELEEVIKVKSEEKRQKRMQELKLEMKKFKVLKEKNLLKEEQKLRIQKIKQQKDEEFKRLYEQKIQIQKQRALEAYKKRKEDQKHRSKTLEEADTIKRQNADKIRNINFFKNAKKKLRALYLLKAESRKKELEEQETKQREEEDKIKRLKTKLTMSSLAVKPDESKHEFKKAWEDLKVQKILDQYNASLLIVFDFYSKLGDSNVLNLNTFNKLCNQFSIIPSLVNNEFMNRMFRGMIKQKINIPNASMGLDYDDFLQCLIQIAIASTRVLEEDNETVMNDYYQIVKGLLQWLSLPQDPKLTREFLRGLASNHTSTNPRDKLKRKNTFLRQLSMNL